VHFVVTMHFSPVLRRDVLILGRYVFGVLLSVRQSLLCIDPPESYFMADQIVYMKLELHGQAIQERELQQINSSGRTMVSICTTRFNIKYSAFYQRTRVL